MTDIAKLIKRLPHNEMAFGGSHGGKIYQDYPWPPLDTLPAKRETTAERLQFIGDNCLAFPWTGMSVLDIGCANGALSIGFAKAGATVTGWDWNKADLDVAKDAAKQLGVSVKFQERSIEGGIREGRWDIIVYLSVWKWIAWRAGIGTANETLSGMSEHCGMLIFESGLTGTGIDLVPVSTRAIEPLLHNKTGFKNIEEVGTFPRDDQQVDRPVWRCW